MHQYNCQDPEVKREERNNSIVMLSKSKKTLAPEKWSKEARNMQEHHA